MEIASSQEQCFNNQSMSTQVVVSELSPLKMIHTDNSALLWQHLLLRGKSWKALMLPYVTRLGGFLQIFHSTPHVLLPKLYTALTAIPCVVYWSLNFKVEENRALKCGDRWSFSIKCHFFHEELFLHFAGLRLKMGTKSLTDWQSCLMF